MESHKTVYRTFTGRRIEYDSLQAAGTYYRIIKDSDTDEDAYRNIAHLPERFHTNWRDYPQFYGFFQEELEELLQGLGIEKAGAVAELIAKGGYKWKVDARIKQKLPKEVDEWARGVKGMLRRREVAETFAKEYEMFRCISRYEPDR